MQITTISLLLILAACSDNSIETNMSISVADFKFTTQDHETFGSADLDDEWWVAYFLYTDCEIVCPTTTPNMARLQKELKDASVDVQIVSFTVDPEHDTPEVLKEYAQENQADLSNWTFLTGYDFNQIKELSEESFQSSLEGGGTDGMQYAHTTRFFLVNPERKIIKYYNGMITNEVDELISDAKKVAKSK